MSFVQWSPALPFASLLLALLVAPSVSPKLWHRPWARLSLLLVLCSPAVWRDATQVPHRLLHVVDEYASFLLLLWALYQLASGIVLEGPFTGTPKSNAAILALGTVCASALGTTGASMLFLPVLLRANAGRQYTTHLIVLFVFLVSNIGGLLLPLGDPPLFLGFLHGVPFFWTVSLWKEWALNVVPLLTVAYALDNRAYRKESQHVYRSSSARRQIQWRLTGALHLMGFAAVALILVLSASLPWGSQVQQAGLAFIALASFVGTSDEVRRFNHFSWEPLTEVAVLFLPLFLAMPQALGVIEAAAPSLPLASAESFFWWTGGLSSVLDNAPCYLSFATLANARQGGGGSHLLALSQDPKGAPLLMAIAHGAVAMGAATYIGNGPNLMVRARALEAGFLPPSFFGYIRWSLLVLLPILGWSRWIVRFV